MYKTLLQLASDQEELEILGLDRAQVEKWVREWDVPSEDKSSFLQLVAAAFAKCGQSCVCHNSLFSIGSDADPRTTPIRATAYEYTLSYVRSLPPNSNASQTAAVDAIAVALRLPSLFNFDALFRLDPVVAAQNHELFSLLRIFMNDGLSEFQAWVTSHGDSFTKYSTYNWLQIGPFP